MTADMFNRTIEALCRRTPFQPFTILMTGGEKVEIDHPRAISLRGGRAVFTGLEGTFHFFESDTVSKVISDMVGEAHPAA